MTCTEKNTPYETEVSEELDEDIDMADLAEYPDEEFDDLLSKIVVGRKDFCHESHGNSFKTLFYDGNMNRIEAIFKKSSDHYGTRDLNESGEIKDGINYTPQDWSPYSVLCGLYLTEDGKHDDLLIFLLDRTTMNERYRFLRNLILPLGVVDTVWKDGTLNLLLQSGLLKTDRPPKLTANEASLKLEIEFQQRLFELVAKGEIEEAIKLIEKPTEK